MNTQLTLCYTYAENVANISVIEIRKMTNLMIHLKILIFLMKLIFNNIN